MAHEISHLLGLEPPECDVMPAAKPERFTESGL